MDGRAASLTVTDKIPHLMAAGIDPVVISAVTGTRDHRFSHYQVLPWGPAGFRFDMRHLLAIRWGRDWRYRLVTGLISLFLAPFILVERAVAGLQSQWSWTPAAVFRGWKAIRQHQPQLIYSSGGAYSAHWAGYWLKRLTGLPWIAEVHDPMVFPGTVPASRNLKFWARLEGVICRHADRAWWFTEQAHASALRRHPELGDRGFVVLPGAEPPQVEAGYAKGPLLQLGHFGSLSDVRTLASFVELFAEFRERHPDLAEHIRVPCFGGAIDGRGRIMIERFDLGKYFLERGRLERDPLTGLSGRQRIQQEMHRMDALLLIHGTTADCAEYIPSKFYDYLWAGRPVFGLVHFNPQLERLVTDHGGYAMEVDNTEAVMLALKRLVNDWERQTFPVSPLPPLDTRQAVDTILHQVDSLSLQIG